MQDSRNNVRLIRNKSDSDFYYQDTDWRLQRDIVKFDICELINAEGNVT